MLLLVLLPHTTHTKHIHTYTIYIHLQTQNTHTHTTYTCIYTNMHKKHTHIQHIQTYTYIYTRVQSTYAHATHIQTHTKHIYTGSPREIMLQYNLPPPPPPRLPSCFHLLLTSERCTSWSRFSLGRGEGANRHPLIHPVAS